QMESMEKMILLNPEESIEEEDGVKLTISPSARNRWIGATRILTASEPVIKVANKDADGKRLEKAEEIESTVKRMLQQAGRYLGVPIQKPIVESALLYDEIHVAITCMKELAERGNKKDKRLERASKLAPFLLDAWNPRQGYARVDGLGASGYLRCAADVVVGDILNAFGTDADEILLKRQKTDKGELNIWYDSVNWAVWFEGEGLVAEEHGLPFIPISFTQVEGSRLFYKPEERNQGMLYGYWKSKFWERENLLYTVLMTNVFNMGLSPVFIHTNAQGETRELDWKSDNKFLNLNFGEKIDVMVTKGIIDPAFREAMDIVKGVTEESTLYSQALGNNLGGNASFSSLNLVSQTGKIPLISAKTMSEVAIADVCEKMLEWYRLNGQQYEGYCAPNDIPENLQVTVNLEPDLPQDKLQQANVATMLKRDGVADNEWVRSNILNMENSNEMDENIASEQFFTAMVQAYIQVKTQQVTLELQSQGQTQPTTEQGGMDTQQAMSGMPVAQGQGQGFDGSAGGLPPIQGGMLQSQGGA
ncbi:MAG: hypothetical protein WC455_30855, partial [Dehalococcoidia bacterium]